MQQRSLQQVRVSVSLIFLIHGLIIATWASRIPAFQAHLHLSPAVLGRSLMMAAIGSVLAMPAAGWLINKFGSLSIVIGSTSEFSISLCLDYWPEPRNETPWPLKLETDSGQVAIFQGIGDGLLYRGCELPHWRDRLPEGHMSTSIFFHYVPADFAGPLD